MAFLFADGFDFYSYNNSNAPQAHWDTYYYYGNYPCNVSSNTAFGSGQSLTMMVNRTPRWQASWPSNEGTLYLSVRLCCQDLQDTSKYLAFILLDGTAAQMAVCFYADRSIRVHSGDPSGPVLATYEDAFLINVWDSWQVKAVIDPSGGSVELRKNGVAAAAYVLGSVNTRAGSGNSTANGVSMGGPNDGGYDVHFLIDDLFICSGSGAAPNTWPGDMRALQQLPATASQAQFAAAGAASNWQSLAGDDGDGSYVSSSTPGQQDIYTLSAVPPTYAVVGVSYLVNWKKSDSGPRTAQFSVAAGGSADMLLITDAALSNSYAIYRSAFLAVDPAGAPWTPASASGALLGLKVSA